MESRASADRPSAIASRLNPSSVAIPSVTSPPLAALAACTEAADLLRAIAEGDIAWICMYFGARDTMATRRNSILACVFEMEKDCRASVFYLLAMIKVNEREVFYGK